MLGIIIKRKPSGQDWMEKSMHDAARQQENVLQPQQQGRNKNEKTSRHRNRRPHLYGCRISMGACAH